MKIDNGSNATPQDQKEFEESAKSQEADQSGQQMKGKPKIQTEAGPSNWPYNK